MKLKRLILLLIVVLSSCLNSWCQNNFSTGGQNDSVLIPISYIRLANEKLIENKYNKQIIVEQDSLINLHVIKYNVLREESAVLQDKLYTSQKLNQELEKSLRRADNKSKFLGGIAITSIIAFTICILSY